MILFLICPHQSRRGGDDPLSAVTDCLFGIRILAAGLLTWRPSSHALSEGAPCYGKRPTLQMAKYLRGSAKETFQLHAWRVLRERRWLFVLVKIRTDYMWSQNRDGSHNKRTFLRTQCHIMSGWASYTLPWISWKFVLTHVEESVYDPPLNRHCTFSYVIL
jgi:hypothetical protein